MFKHAFRTDEYDEEVFGSDEGYVSFHEHSDSPEGELTEQPWMMILRCLKITEAVLTPLTDDSFFGRCSFACKC